MKEKMTSRTPILVITGVVLLVVIGATVAAQAQGTSMADILGAAIRPVKRGDTIVAVVDGEPVSLQTLERTKAMLQATSHEPLDDSEAYRQAMNHIIRNVVLVREANRRGLTVTEQEARDYLAQVKALAKESPDLQKTLNEEARALGVSGEEFNKRMVETYRKALLIGKLYQALDKEVPPPSEEDIDVYLAEHPGVNAIVLIPIEFRDSAKAEATYAKLRALAATQPAEQFVTTFDGYARRLGDHKPGQFVHRTFRFSNKSELPDYVRSALGKPAGYMGIFERKDGTAVVYLVLRSATVSTQEARESARNQLIDERREGYIEEFEKRLISRAKIKIFSDKLPPAVRGALAPLSR